MSNEKTRYYGVFPGIVVSVDGYKDEVDMQLIDTPIIQRVRVRVAGVDPPDCSAEILPDAIVGYTVASDEGGQFSPVFPGDAVIVSFINGESDKRVIVSRYYKFKGTPSFLSNGYPFREGYISRGGHSIIFDNQSGDIANVNKKTGITILCARGQVINLNENIDEVRVTSASGASISVKGTTALVSDDGINKGIVVNSSPDDVGKIYKININEENEEIEVTSKNDYKAVIRDAVLAGSSEKKGITLRTTPNRSIVIDEETGKMYINHDDEVVVSAAKFIVDNDVQINGKLETTGDIQSGGEIKDTYFGAPMSLTYHEHAVNVPGAVTIPPRT